MVKLSGTIGDQPLWESCAHALDQGQLALVPMETVYGIMGRLDHPNALQRLRQLRPAPDTKPLTVHLGRASDAKAYIDLPDPYARLLMSKLWPGPVALMFHVSQQRQAQVARSLDVAPADLFAHDSITLRCPAHAGAREILRRCHHPIVASAPPGDPARIDSIAPGALEQIEMVLDEGNAHYGKPSTIVRVGHGGFDIVRSGVYDRRIIEKTLRTTILFVCSGNTCRSPMAAGIAKAVLAKHLGIPERNLEKAGYNVMSAGAMAFGGSPATPNAVEALKSMGIDISQHRSRSLTPALIGQADAIFAMGLGHLDVVRRMDPKAAEKAQLLDPEGDIDDPIGGELSLYQSLAGQIQALIERRMNDGSLTGAEKDS